MSEDSVTCASERPGENPPANERIRKIVHVDMDAFFASVEQRDDPSLRGKPVAVGGARQRGVVAAASYEARVFGVRSAMPSVTAARKCPELLFVKPRFDVYKAVSAQIHEIFAEYTPLIEPLSLDEAYLDVTENLKGIAIASEIAEEIRAKILTETGLTASAGISYNKFLAKMASGHNKPNGQFAIPPAKGQAFVRTLPIAKFHGVGPATASKMKGLGIETGADLEAQSLEFLQQHFRSAGGYYYWIARGIDNRRVNPDRVRKSVGGENTFFVDVHGPAAALEKLSPIIDKVWRHAEHNGLYGRTLTLKVKFSDFEIITRSRTAQALFTTREAVGLTAQALLLPVFPTSKGIRLLGISISGFDPTSRLAEEEQLALAL